MTLATEVGGAIRGDPQHRPGLSIEQGKVRRALVRPLGGG
jgi:hypothetical protein